ncbi:preprotein translocase subunit SecG [Brumimicrobium oceani]|uniref:Protein-export membrane protein SecG n=1 Tax=Brumimicrobium oceani TaxID=2100725 RepID=A0A2U2XFG6_9FLAO|nr:preprotein translocase subunit SecG [Brumimicrobium oceani]PWH86497.1 preprotein translocase subunit SecG [Brumimicrobium oceani]
MGTLLTILIMIASILLVLLVLMQNPKGGGLSTDFGSAQQLGGVKQTNDFVEKATWSLAGVIGILSIVMTLMYHEPTGVPAEAAPQETEQPAAPASDAE